MLLHHLIRTLSGICCLFFALTFFMLSSCNDNEACEAVQCQNGGECKDGSCECPEGYMGIYCQYQLCDGAFCQNGGTCNDNVCQCPGGYSGPYCQYASCSVLQCPANASCEENAQGIGECTCTFGYVGNDCSQQLRQVFYGFYNASESCSGGNMGPAATIGADPFGVLNIVLTSNTNTGIFAFVGQVISDDSFTIPIQQLTSTTKIKGLGDAYLNPDTKNITFSYSILSLQDVALYSCSATLTKVE